MSYNKSPADHNCKEHVQKLDNSLRGGARRRAVQQPVPKTATPYH
jgi:hypothetical protein